MNYPGKRKMSRSEKGLGLTAVFFVFMFLLGAFCVVFEPGFGSRLWGAAELFFDLLLVTGILVALNRWSYGLASFLRITLYIILYAVALVDVACYVRLQSPITPIWVETTMLTNSSEAHEALLSFVTPDLLISKVGIVVLLLIANIIAIFNHKLFDAAVYKIRNSIRPGMRMTIMCIIGVIWVADGVLLREDKEYVFYKALMRYDELKIHEIKDLTPKTGNYIPIYRLACSVAEYDLMQSARTGLSGSADRIVIDSCSFTSPHIVLFIGESCNRHHSSLYGYDKPTTPNQQQLAREGELIPFSNVISSWNVTAESLQYMLSMYGVGDEGKWYEYPLVTQFFKQAGYDNLFLSNQYVLNKANSMSDYKEDVYINSPRLSDSQFNRRNSERHKYDDGLINDYDMLFRPESEHTFTIIHFQGIHFNFNDRYPDSMALFTGDDYSRPDLNREQKDILADYDNAMRFNDSVISCLLERLTGTDCIAIFVPDHGERVFDNCQEWGRDLSWNSNDLRQQFEIPFWIWASSQYKELHSDIWSRVTAAKDHRFMTDNLAQMLLGLAGISTPYYKPQNDLLSPSYNQDRPRIVRDERNYDDIILSCGQ